MTEREQSVAKRRENRYVIPASLVESDDQATLEAVTELVSAAAAPIPPLAAIVFKCRVRGAVEARVANLHERAAHGFE